MKPFLPLNCLTDQSLLFRFQLYLVNPSPLSSSPAVTRALCLRGCRRTPFPLHGQWSMMTVTMCNIQQVPEARSTREDQPVSSSDSC